MKPRSPKTHESPQPKPKPKLKPGPAAQATPEPVPRTTAQQSADFTAEGAPPPGRVGTEGPDDAGKVGPPRDADDAAQ